MRIPKGILCLILAGFAMQGSGFAAARALVPKSAKLMSTPYNPYSSIPVVEEGAPEDIRLPAVEKGTWLDRYRETGMTFIEYVTSSTPRPTSTRCTIVLRPLGRFRDSRSLEKLGKMVAAYYQLPVEILPQQEVAETAYSPVKRKYDADEILFNMYEKIPRNAFVYVGITDRDITSGRLSTVFGLAYCDLRSCVVSTRHLCAKPDQIGDRYELIRMYKLVCHEIGHVLGLPHCAAHRCAMNGTTSLSDVEDAPFTLCEPCLRKLSWNIGFDRLKRYEEISAAMREINCSGQALAFNTRIQRLQLDALGERTLALRRSRRGRGRLTLLNAQPRQRIFDMPLVAAIEEE